VAKRLLKVLFKRTAPQAAEKVVIFALPEGAQGWYPMLQRWVSLRKMGRNQTLPKICRGQEKFNAKREKIRD
jgi:hypothetical protein